MMKNCLVDALFDEPMELDQSLLGFMNRDMDKTLTQERHWEWCQPFAANPEISSLENLDELLKIMEPELFTSNKLDFNVVSCLPSALEPTPIKPGLFLYQREHHVKGFVSCHQKDRTIIQSGEKKRNNVLGSDLRANKRPKTASSKKMCAQPHFRPYQHHQFQKRYEALLRFKEQHGHCLVPHTYDEDPSLARWVKRQRYQYKMKAAGNSESTMTEKRISMLEAIGFVWDSHKLAWEDHLEELKRYKEEHGDCNVPSTYTKNPSLGAWVKCQRRQYRRLFNGESYNITFERITSLDALGFDWKQRNELL